MTINSQARKEKKKHGVQITALLLSKVVHKKNHNNEFICVFLLRKRGNY